MISSKHLIFCFCLAFFYFHSAHAALEIDQFISDNLNAIDSGKPCSTTSSGRNHCPPQVQNRPSLPPCINKYTDYQCAKNIDSRNVTYCRTNFHFGRISCCKTCASRWALEELITVKEAEQQLSVPLQGCRDAVATDGKSYTKWCEKNVLNVPRQFFFNCYTNQLVQLRCLKTCGLC